MYLLVILKVERFLRQEMNINLKIIFYRQLFHFLAGILVLGFQLVVGSRQGDILFGARGQAVLLFLQAVEGGFVFEKLVLQIVLLDTQFTVGGLHAL